MAHIDWMIRTKPIETRGWITMGDMGAGSWWVGVSRGLFNDILSVAEWVSRIASGAEKIIHECLSGCSR